jgi:hypothetical protein
MAKTLIRGNTQIMAGTITDTEISASAAIALSKLAEAVVQADGGQAFTNDQSMGSHKITNLADGSGANDAVNKGQLDAAVAGATGGSGKNACRVATTANIALSGTQTIDGVALSASDRVFVKNQSAPAENGIYVVAAGAWSRDTDGDSWNDLVSAIIPISEGTANADTVWLITADRGGTLNTTAVGSVQLPGPSDLVAGAGLTRTGQTVDVVAGDTTIVANANEIHVGLDAAGAIVNGTGIKVNLGSTTGLQITSNALGIKLDGASLTVGANGLKVTTPTPSFADRETPTGSVNSSNTSYSLANTPVVGSEHVYLNGILQEPGAGNDYTISGATITYLTAPTTGDRLRVSYRY